MKILLGLLFSLILINGSIPYYQDEDLNKYDNPNTLWNYPENDPDWGQDKNISSFSTMTLQGKDSGHYVYYITGVGDLNNDGFDDFGVNIRGDKHFIFFGNSSMDFKNYTYNDFKNIAAASFLSDSQIGMFRGPGDINGDGYDDLFFHETARHEVFIFFGKPTGWKLDTYLSSADASYVEESENSGLKIGPTVGDVNGDGLDDLLMYGLGIGKAYLVFGKRSGWGKKVSILNANASFLKEDGTNFLNDGAGVGDVNGDGYDDILTHTSSPPGGNGEGKSYLIFGKQSGWQQNVGISSEKASFIGESANDDAAPTSWSNSGDINNDGFDDIIIGANNHKQPSGCGTTYIIFGKVSGWIKNMNLANADASLLGEQDGDGANDPCVVGDVNDDGIDDLLIGAGGNDEGGEGVGQTYLIYGRPNGWYKNMNLSNADASFIGELEYPSFGAGHHRKGYLGDLNGDGFDDLCFTSNGGAFNGKAYIMMGRGYSEPKQIISINLYSDDQYSERIDQAEIGDYIYIEVIGIDGNDSHQDKTRIYIDIENEEPITFPYQLKETGINTGIYRNYVKLTLINNILKGLIKVNIGDNINISSKKDPSKFSLIEVIAPIALKPLIDDTDILEDKEYLVHYWNFGYNNVSEWIFESNSKWLKWDNENHNLYGKPNNGDVGSCWARLNVTDGAGHFDEHYFGIQVINTPPCILNENNLTAYEGEQYSVDYECDDEGLGHTFWEIHPTYIRWLDFDDEKGILNGIPSNDDVGTYDINISVDDGNGGKNWTAFILTVIDINDPPEILTEPISSIDQGKNYYVQFNAYDQDDINTFEWAMETDAIFLEIDNITGTVSGMPSNDDIGIYFVNITATDLRGLSDWINYTLEVIDVNDAPTWTSTPSDTKIDQGVEFTFDVEAIDVDKGDSITYGISSQPVSNIAIDTTNGMITWIGSLEGLVPNPNYVLNLEVTATDGKESISHAFTIRVIPNPSPTSTILGPMDGIRITSDGVLLEWEGADDGEEPLRYDIYLGTSQTEVSLTDRNVLFREDIDGNSIHTGPLEKGKTYYWTVIPKDVFSSGICTNGVFSFVVNIPPTLQEFSIPQGKVGVEFRLNLVGSDQNNDDLEFDLEVGPVGMEMTNEMITWTPSEKQVGIHTVNISLTDGYDTIYQEFEIEVAEKEVLQEPDGRGSPALMIIIIITVILLLAGAGIGVFIFFKKKKETSPEETSEENTTQPENSELTEQGQEVSDNQEELI